MASSTIINTEPKLGEGIYLTKDVADILCLPYTRVRHWMNEFWDFRFGNASGVRYSFGAKGNKAINFYTLVEFYTFYKLREKKVSAQQIQKAHSIMAKEMNTPYPFAAAENIWTDERNKVWYEHLEGLVRVDGKSKIYIKDFVQKFLRRLDYGDNNLAARYYPLEDSNEVVVDPKHQFGQPTIYGTNIQTTTLYQFYLSGEKPEDLCKLYDLSPVQVDAAITYHKLRAAA